MMFIQGVSISLAPNRRLNRQQAEFVALGGFTVDVGGFLSLAVSSASLFFEKENRYGRRKRKGN